MTERELQLARAIKAMFVQYVHKRGDLVDSNAMSAPEMAIQALAAYGLMEVVWRGRMFGRWTEAGEKL